MPDDKRLGRKPWHTMLDRLIWTLARAAAQVGLLFALFQLYKMARKTFIQRAESVGHAHAEQIIDLERWLRIDIELTLQRHTLDHEWLIQFFNRYYAYFMWAFFACAAVTMLLAPVEYRRLRRVFFLSMLIALPWYAIYPLAPPRFMTDYGFVDTLAVYGPNYFSNTGLVKANQYAAMPSMHVGWTIIGGVMLGAAIPKWRIGATLGALHIALLNVAVVVTGNHYVLDSVGGLLVVATAFGIARLLPEELPWPWRRSATKDVYTETRLPAARARQAARLRDGPIVR